MVAPHEIRHVFSLILSWGALLLLLFSFTCGLALGRLHSIHKQIMDGMFTPVLPGHEHAFSDLIRVGMHLGESFLLFWGILFLLMCLSLAYTYWRSTQMEKYLDRTGCYEIDNVVLAAEEQMRRRDER